MKTNETYAGRESDNKADKKEIRSFAKFYPRLFWLFKPEEASFIVAMQYFTGEYSREGNTVYSKRNLREKFSMGERVFEHCVKRMTSLGLMDRKPQGNMYEYLWNEEAYGRLLHILHDKEFLPYKKSLVSFLKENLFEHGRTVLSISDRELDKFRRKKGD